MEIWRDIRGYEGIYQVSNLGRIKSLPRNGTIKQERIVLPSKGRYLQVGLRNGLKNGTYLIHRLVAEAFLPNPDSLPVVDHIDGDKHNNCVDNLRWCSQKENVNNPATRWKSKTKLLENGIRMGKPIVMKDLNGNVLNTFTSIREAMRQTGIDRSNISAALRKKTYIDAKGKSHTWRTAGGYLWEYAEKKPSPEAVEPPQKSKKRKNRTATQKRNHEIKSKPVSSAPMNLDGEIWKPIAGFPFYEASSYGRIRSKDKILSNGLQKPYIKKGRILVQNVSRDGAHVTLVNKDGKSTKNVARLIMDTFGKLTEGLEVFHIDGDVSNCRFDNLVCMTRKEYANMPEVKARSKRFLSKRRTQKGGECYQAKSVMQYDLDGNFIAEFDCIKEARIKSGASKIAEVCSGKRKKSGGFIWKYKDII